MENNIMHGFNVLECIQDLRRAGFTQEQAEAQAKHIEKSHAHLETYLATKKDLNNLEERLSDRIDLRFQKVQLWLSGVVIATGGIVVMSMFAMIRFLFQNN